MSKPTVTSTNLHPGDVIKMRDYEGRTVRKWVKVFGVVERRETPMFSVTVWDCSGGTLTVKRNKRRDGGSLTYTGRHGRFRGDSSKSTIIG